MIDNISQTLSVVLCMETLFRFLFPASNSKVIFIAGHLLSNAYLPKYTVIVLK